MGVARSTRIRSLAVAVAPRGCREVDPSACELHMLAAMGDQIAVHLTSDAPRRGPARRQRVSRLLALATLGAVDHHEPRTTPVDPRHLGRLQWQHHQCCPVAPVLPPLGVRRRPEIPYTKGFVTRPRGFEPLTFGSVDRRLRREFGSSKPNSRGRVARKSPEIKNRDRCRRVGPRVRQNPEGPVHARGSSTVTS